MNAYTEKYSHFIESTDNEDVKWKSLIKEALLSMPDLLYAIGDYTIDPVEQADIYFNKYIYETYTVPDTQNEVKNCICFETGSEVIGTSDYGFMKNQNLSFYIICDNSNLTDEQICYIPRHDLIGALIIDYFSRNKIFGNQLILTTNEPDTIDKTYAVRKLIFTQITTNSVMIQGEFK